MNMMQSEITHRGIRQNQVEVTTDCWLGHTRLPIQGLDSKWDHPFINKKGNIFSGVGEFFDFREKPGESEAENDFDVFIKYYEKMGDRAFARFDGFWSFIAYNNDSQNFYIYTDFLAKKPLYYRCLKPDTYAVSSEIKPLMTLDDVTADELYFSTVAKWGYCMDNRTPYKEITKIPANTCMAIRLGRTPSFYQYMVPLAPKTKYNIRERIVKAVERRMISDIPVAILCSGGLDSTIILKIVQGITDNYHVFTVPNGTDAEFVPYLEIPPDKLTTLNLGTLDLIYNSLYWNESPVDLGSVLPQYALSCAIKKEGYNVVLSGDGADELFGGYGRARKYDSQYSDIFHELVFYHLPRLDKLMMANTIELRCPFLSRDIVEGAMAIVREQRTEKQFLKKLFPDLVPKEIRDRDKEPLKITELRKEDTLNYRLDLIDMFREENCI